MNRKATDILLDLEQRLDKLLALANNHDLLLKNLNNRIRLLELSKGATSLTQEVSNKSLPGLKVGAMPGLKPGAQLFSEAPKVPIEGLTEGFEEPGKDEVEEELKPKGKRRVSRYVKGEKNRSIPIQQRIVYSDGKNVCLAKVEIFSGDKLVKSLKTNVSGKWKYALDPGNYKVSISKRATSNKPTVNINYDFQVPESEGQIQLDTLNAE